MLWKTAFEWNDSHNIIVLHSSINGVKMLILNLPAAEQEGPITVEVRGKSDKTGKSSDLGQTKFYYFDECKKALKQIVQIKELYGPFFEAWNAACKGQLTDGSEKETKSSGSGKHERPLDIFYRSQVNVEFVVKKKT